MSRFRPRMRVMGIAAAVVLVGALALRTDLGGRAGGLPAPSRAHAVAARPRPRRRQARAPSLRVVGHAHRVEHPAPRLGSLRRSAPHRARHGQGAFSRSRNRGPAQSDQGCAAGGPVARRGQFRASAIVAFEARLGAACRHRAPRGRRGAERRRLRRREEGPRRTAADGIDGRQRQHQASRGRSLHFRRRSRRQRLEFVGQRAERERAQRGARAVAAIVPPSWARRSARTRLGRAEGLGRGRGRGAARAEPARSRARSRSRDLR